MNAFEEDTDDGKAGLAESEAVEPDLFERAVPANIELDTTFAARACPVDVIKGYDDGEQLVRPDGTTTASLTWFTAQLKTPTARLNTLMTP